MKRMMLTFLTVSLFLISLNLLRLPTVVQAQRPTATAVPLNEEGEGKSDAIPPLVGGVQGYVYNYSAGGATQPGVTVVIDGGGWQAEAVTDSSGFYRFAGLGAGSAVLNLRLPPEAHPVTPDWPVFTGSPKAGNTNLAFYWGEESPLPLNLSAEPAAVFVPANEEFNFDLTVHNNSSDLATGTTIDLKLPAATQALQATITRGQIDFTDHRLWGLIDELPAGETATLSVRVKFDEAKYPQRLVAEAALTYKEELTPQRLQIDLTAAEPSAMAITSQTQPAQAAASIVSTSTDPAASQVQNLMPVTGETTSLVEQSGPISILALLFVICLGAAGMATFFMRKQRARGAE